MNTYVSYIHYDMSIDITRAMYKLIDEILGLFGTLLMLIRIVEHQQCKYSLLKTLGSKCSFSVSTCIAETQPHTNNIP